MIGTDGKVLAARWYFHDESFPTCAIVREPDRQGWTTALCGDNLRVHRTERRAPANVTCKGCRAELEAEPCPNPS